ncbi:MAG: hypothetical protein AB3N23_14510 [Paracoccaceae bacterium]
MPAILQRAAMLALCALGPSMALSDMPITYRDDGRSLFHLTVPDFWTVRAGGQRSVTPPGSEEARLINRVIGLQPQTEDGVWMGFMSPHGVQTYDQAVEYLSEIGRFVVTEPEVTTRERVTVGGRPAARFAGTGRRGSRGVNFTAVLIDLPGRRVAISLVVMEADVDPDFVNDVNAVFDSFRVAR